MTEQGWFQRTGRKTLLVAGLVVGLLAGGTVGASGFCYIHVVTPTAPTTQTSFVNACTVSPDTLANSVVVALGGSEPTHSLRLIQAIGILLPLFTGLLRFTTDSSSDVSSRANGLLFLGIVGLVLGGVVTAFSGILTDTAIILKIALSFVVVTFFVIAWVASLMFNEMLESGDRERNESESQLGVVGVNLTEPANVEEQATDDVDGRTETEQQL